VPASRSRAKPIALLSDSAPAPLDLTPTVKVPRKAAVTKAAAKTAPAAKPVVAAASKPARKAASKASPAK
jgi:hypothetical protein